MKSPKTILELCNIKCINVWVRKPLIKKISCHPKAFYTWKLNNPVLSTIKIWAVNKFLLPNKMKELHYKILTIPVILYSQNLSWTSLHNAYSVIITWKQYHTYFLNVIMQKIYGNKCLGLFSQLTTHFLVLK